MRDVGAWKHLAVVVLAFAPGCGSGPGEVLGTWTSRSDATSCTTVLQLGETLYRYELVCTGDGQTYETETSAGSYELVDSYTIQVQPSVASCAGLKNHEPVPHLLRFEQERTSLALSDASGALTLKRTGKSLEDFRRGETVFGCYLAEGGFEPRAIGPVRLIEPCDAEYCPSF